MVRQSEHLRTILDIQYDYLNALAEEIGKTDHLLAKEEYGFDQVDHKNIQILVGLH